MFQKIATASFLLVISIGFPVLILCRPAPPREPLTLHNIQRVGELRWEAHYKAKPIQSEITPWANLIKEQLGTTDEPVITIGKTSATITFPHSTQDSVFIDSLLRLRMDEEHSDYSVVTTPWPEKEEALQPMAKRIREIDNISQYKEEHISVVQHPHNPSSRYMHLAFAAPPAETY